MLLVILATTYSKKVLVMVGSKIIDMAMGMMTKGELVKETMTWKQAHFSAVMSGSLQLPHTDSKRNGEVEKGVTPSPGSDPTAPGMMSGDLSVALRGSPFPHWGLSVYMAIQVSGATACRSMCFRGQHKAPSCPPL